MTDEKNIYDDDDDSVIDDTEHNTRSLEETYEFLKSFPKGTFEDEPETFEEFVKMYEERVKNQRGKN